MTFRNLLVAIALLAAPTMAEPAASAATDATEASTGPRALEPVVAQYQVF